MAQLRTAKAGDVGAFPGSTFVIDDTPPITQCQESQITAINCLIAAGLNTIQRPSNFSGIDLTDKKVTVTNTLVDDGIYDILSNDDDFLHTSHTFANDDATTTIAVHDAGQVYLTRNESSFQRFIENSSKAHTTKGGQLYTDVADPPLNNACSDTFDPQ